MSIPNQILDAKTIANRCLSMFQDLCDYPGPTQWDDESGWHATKRGKAHPALGAIGHGSTREEAMADLERIWPAKCHEAKIIQLRSDIAELIYEMGDKPAELERMKAELARLEADGE